MGKKYVQAKAVICIEDGLVEDIGNSSQCITQIEVDNNDIGNFIQDFRNITSELFNSNLPIIFTENVKIIFQRIMKKVLFQLVENILITK